MSEVPIDCRTECVVRHNEGVEEGSFGLTRSISREDLEKEIIFYNRLVSPESSRSIESVNSLGVCYPISPVDW